jgi:WD40 repeat protein
MSLFRSLSSPFTATPGSTVVMYTVILVAQMTTTLALAQASRQPVLQLQMGHSSRVQVGFSASPNGRLVASIETGGVIKLWETTDGRLLCTMDPGDGQHPALVDGQPLLAWSEDATELLSASSAGGYFRWYLRQCGERTVLDEHGAPAPEPSQGQARHAVRAMTTLSDNRVLVQTYSGLVELTPFSAKSAKVAAIRALPLPNSNANPRTMRATAGNGRFVLLGDLSGPRSLFDRQTGIEQAISDFVDADPSVKRPDPASMRLLPQGARSYSLSHSGRWLAIKSATDNTLRLYDMAVRKLVASIPLLLDTSHAQQMTAQNAGEYYFSEVNRAGVTALAFSADETKLYVLRDGGKLSLEAMPTLEVRQMGSLALLSQIRLPRASFSNASGRVIVAKKGASDQLFIPVSYSTGPGLLAVTVTPTGNEVERWGMDAVARVGALAYGESAWFVQGADVNPESLPERAPLPSNLTATQVQELLAVRNRMFQTYVDVWSADRISASRALLSNTATPLHNVAAFSANGRFHAVETVKVTGGAMPPMVSELAVWDTATGKRLWAQPSGQSGGFAQAVTFSSSGAWVALWAHNLSGGVQQLKLFDGRTGLLKVSFPINLKRPNNGVRLVASEDDTTLFFWDSFGETGAIDVSNPREPRLVWSRNSAYTYPLAFLPKSGRLIMPALAPHVLIEKDSYAASLYGGWPGVLRVPVPEARGVAVASADESLLAVAQTDRTIRLVNLRGAAPQLVGQLGGFTASIVQMAFSPDGRRLLAGDEEGGVWLWDLERQQLVARMYSFPDGSWVVVDSQGRFDTNNIEGFKRLHWVLPDEPFRAYPLELFMRDFFEPQLLPRLLAGAPLPPVPDVASINRAQPEVSIASITPNASDPSRVDVSVRVRPTVGVRGRTSGAADLRLFRAGQLVASSPLTDPATSGPLGINKEAVVRFSGIRLPSDAQAVEISAYAFNTDRVKSKTATLLHQRVATAAVPKRRAVVISIGVNRHDQAAWNLTYAANDAAKTQDVLAQKLKSAGSYSEITTVALISDEQRSHAKKAVLQTVLQALAGQPHDRALLAGIPQAERLQALTPDDVLIVTFAGHGFNEAGEFYLVPQDVSSDRQVGDSTRRSSISTQELAQWVGGIDAGDISLVIDACHSAAAVELGGFKPGPMGAKGFGQMAYDKGMRVLAATQADDVALESGSLQHGLLTFSLVNEGLAMNKADFKPVDKKIDVAEWLNFGAQRVPEIYADVRAGRRAINSPQGAWQFSQRAAASTVKASSQAIKLQRPTLFDFRRAAQPAMLSVTQ